MNLRKLVGISALGLAATLATLPFGGLPAVAEIAPLANLIAQAKPEIILNLGVARKATEATVGGKEKVTWEELADSSPVAPGDVLRYTIRGENKGADPAKNLAVTQPIPEQMVYRLDTATSKDQAEITYSIDEGKTFVAKPQIEVAQEDGTKVKRPAPAEAYTHIRWKFPTVTPEAGATAMYKVQVQ